MAEKTRQANSNPISNPLKDQLPNYIKEGRIPVTGGHVWYGIVGGDDGIPLVVLHGGPGWPHDMLVPPLSNLSNERSVIFYDQLGCGFSERPTDKSLWRMGRFVSELGEVINGLRLEKYHVFGHSFGSAIAAYFALTKPDGLSSLILSSPYLSTQIWEKGTAKLLESMPEDIQKAIIDYEKYGKNKKMFEVAIKKFYDRFLTAGVPQEYWEYREKTGYLGRVNNEIYEMMWGPDELKATGNMKYFDLTGRLHEIKVPTLLLCGRFDEARPEALGYFQSLIPNSRIKIFEASGHTTYWSEREEYVSTIRGFLRDTDENNIPRREGHDII